MRVFLIFGQLTIQSKVPSEIATSSANTSHATTKKSASTRALRFRMRLATRAAGVIRIPSLTMSFRDHTTLAWPCKQGLFRSSPQCALQRRIEPAGDCGNLFVVKLTEQGRRFVVLED